MKVVRIKKENVQAQKAIRQEKQRNAGKGVAWGKDSFTLGQGKTGEKGARDCRTAAFMRDNRNTSIVQ